MHTIITFLYMFFTNIFNIIKVYIYYYYFFIYFLLHYFLILLDILYYYFRQKTGY
jgi:hypothetical protein